MGLFDNVFGKKENGVGVEWISLTDINLLDEIKEKSKEKPQLLFKHSTRCSISTMAKNRFEREWSVPKEKADVYYLDLIAYRPISNKIADLFNVTHQSPQAILVKNGEVVYHDSHNGISAEAIKNHI